MVVVAIYLQRLEQKQNIAVQQVPPVSLAPAASCFLLHVFVIVGLTLCPLDVVGYWKISETIAFLIFNCETWSDT